MVPTIFVLDDDLVYAKLLAANLGSPGRVRTRVFERPDELLAHHAEEPPDAVITDLVMPDLNGVEVTRRLRVADPHLPIFVLTGHADIATAVDALKAGANEYLTKPVNIDELLTLLTRALADRPLLEADLFGYKKGAFTDAREAKRGLIEVADGGTLLLDEIAELGPELQAKLLNFLESRRFRRLGGTDEIEVAVRLITATNRNLEEQLQAGR